MRAQKHAVTQLFIDNLVCEYTFSGQWACTQKPSSCSTLSDGGSIQKIQYWLNILSVEIFMKQRMYLQWRFSTILKPHGYERPELLEGWLTLCWGSIEGHWSWEPHSRAKKLQILPGTPLKCVYWAKVNQAHLLVFIPCTGYSLFHQEFFECQFCAQLHSTECKRRCKLWPFPSWAS